MGTLTSNNVINVANLLGIWLSIMIVIKIDAHFVGNGVTLDIYVIVIDAQHAANSHLGLWIMSVMRDGNSDVCYVVYLQVQIGHINAKHKVYKPPSKRYLY